MLHTKEAHKARTKSKDRKRSTREIIRKYWKHCWSTSKTFNKRKRLKREKSRGESLQLRICFGRKSARLGKTWGVQRVGKTLEKGKEKITAADSQRGVSGSPKRGKLGEKEEREF